MTQSRPTNRRSLLVSALAGTGAWAMGAGVLAQGVAKGQARVIRIPITATGQAAIGRTRGRLQFGLEDLGLRYGSPIYLRLIKDQKRLEIWVQRQGQDYVRLRAYRICGTSAPIGPMRNDNRPTQPEGFYAVGPNNMRPAGAGYLGVALNAPNVYDRLFGARDAGSLLQAGCAAAPHFGMTDQDMEEVYTLIYGALIGGQTSVPVHIFPFAMGALGMMSHGNGVNADFWRELEPAWRAFERTKRPPQVQILRRRYIVTAVGG